MKDIIFLKLICFTLFKKIHRGKEYGNRSKGVLIRCIRYLGEKTLWGEQNIFYRKRVVDPTGTFTPLRD